MTRDATRPARPADGIGYGNIDDVLLAGLWENAPLARLPPDAPAELRDFVEDIESPRRVYAIHRASRRHNFQLLVEKYITQLREGCGSSHCTTPSCFSCRKRVVGKAPIRRYNTTSARVLAVYLASQDNPEGGLCPALRPPKGPPAALDALVFAPKHASHHWDDQQVYFPRAQNGFKRGAPRKERQSGGASKQPGHKVHREEKDAPPSEKAEAEQDTGEHHSVDASPSFTVREKTAGKDYRSFAANMFGTVAFKMLEWLTPNSIEEMSRRVQELEEDMSPEEKPRAPTPRRKRTGSGEEPPLSPLSSPSQDRDVPSEADGTHTSPLGTHQEHQPVVEREPNGDILPWPVPSARPANVQRNSNARVRTSSANKPRRQLSLDTFSPDPTSEELLSGLRSPKLAGLQQDKTTRALKSSASSLARPISQLSPAGYLDFDSVPLGTMPPSRPAGDGRPKSGRGQLDGWHGGGVESPGRPGSDHGRTASDYSASEGSLGILPSDPDDVDDGLLPQALSRLDADIIDFVCDVLQEDGTAESHVFEPQTVTRFHTQPSTAGKPLTRAKGRRRASSPDLATEWRLFIEQSLFYVLSDPKILIRSFTRNEQLYDSQTLWYCMLRMSRVAPAIVFHSLWLAAAKLFVPPRSLQTLRSPSGRLFRPQWKTLSNTEAGLLMSICLHALVAAAPLVADIPQLYDMSRLRAHGLSLAGSGSIARQPVDLCLQYDDAFGHDLTMRLARRLLAAITTRRYFDEMIEHDPHLRAAAQDEPDVLAAMFSQLDFLNMDGVYILNFSVADRSVHETRVPTLLLDWARAVMLNDWDGQPVVPGDGPFGGALTLIEAMYKRRQALLLTEGQFRAEYFAERLDSVEMPVAWLSFTPTKRKRHLLDFPYIFNPSTLVSYFRSINFSRMSRAFEESSSLKNRMEHIIQPGSLIINPHHKTVLQDMLRTASSKYLVLDISRKHVIKDAFDQLWRREERELLRPLKVHLGEEGGEEGFDSGGVQQEFFRLAVAEALDPAYGAFTVDERTRMTWFQPGSLEPEWKLELVGLLVSLAVYNGLTLPVTFPKALYRKLLGEPVAELHHIADGWPDLANGLTTLLEWDEKDGLVEDVFARTYEFSVSVFDEPVSRQMAPPPPGGGDPAWPQPPRHPWQSSPADPGPSAANPADAPLVTNANRNAYVSDYIRYLTDVSVRPQYEAFARGFRACLHPRSLALLTPPLLQSVVEGVQDIDVAELRRHARYVGWDAGHRTVRDFWSVVRRYDDRMRRRLLEFVTASDRVPVGGIQNLQFVVQRNGAEEGAAGHLPTAYTCYGTLLLPEYRDKEVLRERLAMALENAQGFGFA